jgi:predicted flap endonuclease-1-like 5' DNA nuclease
MARAIGRMKNNLKLSRIAVYIAANDEVALYRKPIHPTELTSLKGIGVKRAVKLQSCGVRSVQDLVNFDPKELSKKLHVSEKRVSKWINEARKNKHAL